ERRATGCFRAISRFQTVLAPEVSFLSISSFRKARYESDLFGNASSSTTLVSLVARQQSSRAWGAIPESLERTTRKLLSARSRSPADTKKIPTSHATRGAVG